MSGYNEAKHGELARINRLVEEYERVNEEKHRRAGEPLQQAFLYSSDPSGRGDDSKRKFIFGTCQVVGLDTALLLIKQIAVGYGIEYGK
jgi:hypothetical protein